MSVETQDDWRQRYLDLNRDLEAERSDRADAERLLTRTITRLCVAVHGMDPFLDPPLERLRKTVQGGWSPRLAEHLGDFADAVVAAGDQRRSDDLVGRLLARAGAEPGTGEKAKALWLKLAAAPAGASDEELDRLAGLLGLKVAAPAAAGPPRRSLLGWFGREAPSSEPSANQVLAELMGRMRWPEGLAAEVTELRGRLAADGGDGQAWVEVIERISVLATDAVRAAEVETRRTEAFLGELSERLEALDLHMQGEQRRRGEARERAAELGRTMRSEVGGLSRTLHQEGDLRTLRQSLDQTLDRIQRSVQQHLDLEEVLRRQAEEREGRLTDMLHQVERRTEELQREVASSQQLARQDSLTGLPNRRAYEERLEHEYARWRRFGGRLSLLVWDVDNFKAVNDTYGHKAGDRALQLIAVTLQQRLRETDFMARLGGEEFVALLIGADAADAWKVAESMREAVANAGLHSNNTPVALTVSGGLSQFADGDDPVRVFQRADEALYRAKRAGKNRCEVN